MRTRNLDMLVRVARGLKDKRDNFVFLGGATVSLYATDVAAPESRPTFDVDCIVEITSYLRFAELEDELRQLGFVNDVSEDAPRCRYLYDDIKVDVMPTPLETMGFNNKWYTDGVQHTAVVDLAPGVQIKVLIMPYFLASKFEALANRGMVDLRTSTDFEDIVFLLRNRKEVVDEIAAADTSVKEYIVQSVSRLLKIDYIDESISSALDRGDPPGTAKKIKQTMEAIRSS